MKTINVFIIHGAYGYPEENWFGWLKAEINRLGIVCYNPRFPTPQKQSLTAWINVFNQTYRPFVTPESILIGHSLGAVFCLKWLEEQDCLLRSVVLAGVFVDRLGIEKFDAINDSFIAKPFNWQHIIKRSKEFICFHGDNDPYVPRYHMEHVTHQLHAKKIIISQGGHLNKAAGYTRFPHLLIYLKHIIANTSNL